MIIGIPKEIMHEEARVAVIPETVKNLIKEGHTVVIETNAGVGSHFSDEDYVAAGAKIEKDVTKLYADADIILKVKEPLFNDKLGKHEIELMHEGQYLITFIHPAAPANHQMVQDMAKQGVISFTLDGIPRISRAQNMDALTSMSTCAGYKGMLLAYNALPKFVPPIFCAVGAMPPAKALVIGAGVGGLQALATAKRMGASLKAIDIRPMGMENAKSLGAKIVETGVPADVAIAEGGYAKALSDEWLKKEREAIFDTVVESDVIFCSALVPGETAPVLITEEMVKKMKSGSVIVDISIDQGGNCEITEPGEVVQKHGVTLIGIKNIPGLLPTSSTWMFSKNIENLVKYMVKDNKITIDMDDEIFSKSLVTIDGKIVHKGTLKALNK
ncbi:MAG TPA: NAD(P) transhydrogenase subunit alpha [Clostridiales bacterium]|nr:NAD(P) transhydrogenase subunit alpha [Clostridiales bacterium]